MDEKQVVEMISDKYVEQLLECIEKNYVTTAFDARYYDLLDHYKQFDGLIYKVVVEENYHRMIEKHIKTALFLRDDLIIYNQDYGSLILITSDLDSLLLEVKESNKAITPWIKTLDLTNEERQHLTNRLLQHSMQGNVYNMTVSNAAEEWDICREHIATLCREKKIDAVKVSKIWLIHKDQKNPRTHTTRRRK